MGLSRIICIAAIWLAAPALAQETASISDVIEAFKAEIREVQTRDSGDCVLRISKVEFRFDAGRRLGFDGNAGGEVEMFGVKLGASAARSASQSDTSTVRITLLPDPGAADGSFDVSGDGTTSFADLIANTKAQIETAAASEPRFVVGDVVIETGFAVETKDTGKVSIAIVGGGGTGTSNSGNRVTLTLAPPEPGSC